MRVAIILHPFGTSAKGLEQYIFDSTRSMIDGSDETITFTVFVKGNPDTSGLPNGVRVINLPKVSYWHLYLLRQYTSFDTFVFFTESAPVFFWRKSIVVCLDVAYYYFPSPSKISTLVQGALVWWRKSMMRYARHVVTISEASKKDLVEIFSVPKEHVSVIYPGFKSLVCPESVSLQNQKPYFMYIGPVKERKNVARIVTAFELFKKETGLPHQLFLVGRKSRGAYEEKVDSLVAQSAYKDDILFKTSVTDDDLALVYASAEALVFPSLLEGFGLPVLEAFSCNCMVITASTTSTKEASGDVGLLVDPTSEREIADAMIRVARREYDRGLFIEKAKTQVSRFSWEKSGEEWRQVLKNCTEV